MGDPVGAEVVGNVEHASLGESEAVEEGPRGGDIWAVGPGAASAVEEDGLGAGQPLDAGAEGIEAGGAGGGSGVFGAGNVGLVEEHTGADLEDEVRARVDLEFLVQGFRLDERSGGDGGGRLGMDSASGEGQKEREDLERGTSARDRIVHNGTHSRRRSVEAEVPGRGAPPKWRPACGGPTLSHRKARGDQDGAPRIARGMARRFVPVMVTV